MALNTPAWWYKRNALGAPWWRPVLRPLAWLWQAVNDAKRAKATPYRSSLFVISVGNLTLGGSGKTPVTAEILRLLGDRKVSGLSKGHGGRVEGPVRVNPGYDTAAEVGDEPLMLARHVPFMVAKDRPAGLRALEPGMDIAVVDDAHQNLTIAKDLHILVVDGDTRDNGWPFGDGGICPYGPMREPFGDGFARADLVVVWMPDDQPVAPDLMAPLSAKPVFIARLTAEAPDLGSPLLAFAGIAKPWKFEATLRSLGAQLAGFIAYPDHAGFSAVQLKNMQAKADAAGARLITTEKDWVRLDAEWRAQVLCLPITARFDDEAGFRAALVTALDKSQTPG